MPRISPIIAKTAKDARRAMLAALGGGVIAIAGLTAGQEYSQGQRALATERLLEARAAADRVALLQNRLDLEARLAAATGEESWMTQYAATLTELDEAIAAVALYANLSDGFRFQSEVRLAHDKVAERARLALDQARAGDLGAARSILTDPVQPYHQGLFQQSIERFIAAMADDVQDTLARLHRWELSVIAAFILLTGLAAFALWRQLAVNLAQAERLHAEAEGKIKRLAMNDVLTGLSNRLAFRTGLKTAISRAESAKSKLAVMMIDLDRFKPINDRYGHLVGDLILKEVADRLRSVGRIGDIRARFGGDEFVAVVEYENDDRIPIRAGEQMVERLSEPIRCNGLNLEVGASVGLAIYPDDANDDEALLAKADFALYRAKRDGRGAVRRFDASMDDAIKEAAQLEAEMPAAIKSQAITPYFQPLIDLATGTVTGFEVLARWHHPSKGLVQPADFIKIAEKSTLIDDLAMALLTRACMEMRSLPPHLTLAINLSSRQIQDERIAHRILAVLSKTKFSPSRLEVELTESALVNDIEAAKTVIRAFKRLGVRIALDDFGTGYSSLSYLSELPFDKIKIDRSFIRTLHNQRESAKVVSAIVGLGKSLGVPIIAEGIETARDEEVVRTMGCSIAQGFYYSQPVPAVELPGLLAKTYGAAVKALPQVVAVA